MWEEGRAAAETMWTVVEEGAEANILRGTRRSGLRSVALLIEAVRLVRWEKKTVREAIRFAALGRRRLMREGKSVDVVMEGPQGGKM